MNNISYEYKPISMWGYFGYQLLYSIPLIGFIILIINAISHPNINVRNYSRSFFCGLIIALIITFSLLALGVLGNISSNFAS